MKQTFEEFNQLLKDPKQHQKISFDITLPAVEFDDDLNDINDHKTDSESDNNPNGVTMHAVTEAQDHTGDSFPVSLIAQKLYNDKDIISAFQALYSKYIDEKDAPFMINISSQNRKQLKLSLDKDYCDRQNYHLNDLTNKTLILKLVTEMDQAAFEVSELMFGSFARFRSRPT